MTQVGTVYPRLYRMNKKGVSMHEGDAFLLVTMIHMTHRKRRYAEKIMDGLPATLSEL